MIGLAVFVVSLALSVSVLGAAFSVWDNAGGASAFGRLIVRLALVSALLWWIPPSERSLFVWALTTVAALHVLSYLTLRLSLRSGAITNMDVVD